MAYPYFPATYQPIYPQYAQNQPVQAFQPQGGVNTQPMQNAQQTANNSLTWVQGIEGAKAHTAPERASASGKVSASPPDGTAIQTLILTISKFS